MRLLTQRTLKEIVVNDITVKLSRIEVTHGAITMGRESMKDIALQNCRRHIPPLHIWQTIPDRWPPSLTGNKIAKKPSIIPQNPELQK